MQNTDFDPISSNSIESARNWAPNDTFESGSDASSRTAILKTGETGAGFPTPPLEIDGEIPSRESGDSVLSESKITARSTLRIKYEAEVSSLKKRIGSLESIRTELGLSQRRMCQLLLVDPSAWTRWTKSGADAPPHIYRMLQWYLAVQEKYPALDLQFWLSNLTRNGEGRGWESEVTSLSNSVASLREERDRAKKKMEALEIRIGIAEGISRSQRPPTENPFQARENAGEQLENSPHPATLLHRSFAIAIAAFAIGILLTYALLRH